MNAVGMRIFAPRSDFVFVISCFMELNSIKSNPPAAHPSKFPKSETQRTYEILSYRRRNGIAVITIAAKACRNSPRVQDDLTRNVWFVVVSIIEIEYGICI